MRNYLRLYSPVLVLVGCLNSGDPGADLPYENDGRVCTSEIPDDGLDQDCDGQDSHACWEDIDGDGFGAGQVQIVVEECRAIGFADLAADCAPIDVSLNPDAFDVPGDGIDQDCNGVDAIRCLADLDGDGFGLGDVVSVDGVCDPLRFELSIGSVDTGVRDCDDGDLTSFPGGAEIAADGVDQDCSGADTVLCWPDGDFDGFGAGSPSEDPSGACGFGSVRKDGDCDDAAAATWPGAPETADDAVDQDCNTFDATACFADLDADGAFGTQALGLDGTCDPALGLNAASSDCDDAQAAAYPGNPEICDGVDNDCDAATLEDGRIDLLGVGAQPDIATALSLAGDEDTIALCTGVFPANLTIDHDVTLRAPPGAEVTLDGAALGPVIEITAGIVVLENLTLSNGIGRDAGAGLTGGALRVAGGDAVVLGGRITGSNATRGGGAWVAAGASARLEGTTIDSNVAVEGGGVAAEGTLTLTNAGVIDNTATDGAGLWLGPTSATSMFSAAIGPNSAIGRGGGFYAAGSVVAHAATLDGNGAAEGGGAWIDPAAEFTGDQLTIAGNLATGDGGGVWIGGGLDLTDTAFDNNDAARGAGAFVPAGGSLSLSRTTLRDNTATAEGGGLWTAGDAVADEIAFTGNGASAGAGVFANSPITLTRVQLVANTATGDAGGAWLGSTANLDSAVITDNVAARGGGLFVHTTGDVTLSNTTLSENTATLAGGGGMVLGSVNVDHTASLRNGAAIGGTWHVGPAAWLGLVDSSVREGVADQGGGLWFGGNGRFERVEIARNEATEGAGLYADGASPELIWVQFRSNTAAADGGGVWARSTHLRFDGGDLADNVAVRGGGLFLSEASADGPLSQGNSATFGGGAAFVGSCGLSHASLHDNDAGTGGGAWVEGFASLEDVDVDVNEAPTGAGLAVTAGGFADLSADTDVFWNHATDGGGAWLEGGAGLAGGTIRENTGVRGGGVYVASTGTSAAATLANLAIRSNQANDGAGLYADGACAIDDAEIASNMGLNGGAIWVGAAVEVARVGVTRNSASNGGAAWIVAGSLTLDEVDLGLGAQDNSPSDIEIDGTVGSWTYGVITGLVCTLGGGCDT
jgi:hypothetical protein